MLELSKVRSPFKFLDPYGKGDKDIFFGRDEEIKLLYEYVNKSQIVLVYGPSGTGKTSLIQCGLANCFDATDWLPFFIRRGRNLNNSLLHELKASKALSGEFTANEASSDQVVQALERISKRYLRTIYLIFDQFEELLILGDKEEKTLFIEVVQKIIQSTCAQSCSMIFVLREEYFGQLNVLEQFIPSFSDRRMRVEPMRPGKLVQVIKDSCRNFNIKLENPNENINHIIKSLDDKSGISLTYLQVYLDQIWREDYARTYPNGHGGKSFPPPLEFTTREILDFGNIKDVIRRFVIERSEYIQSKLQHEFPEINDDTVELVLDCFVTYHGTKLPIEYTNERNNIKLEANAPKYLQELPGNVLQRCLVELESNRILRKNDTSLELTHDKIAEIIYQRRPAERRRLDDIERQIVNNYEEFKQTKEYLTSKQVANYEYAISQLNLEQKYIDFFNKSKKHRNKRRVLKILLFILIPAIILISIFNIRTLQAANQTYALYYFDHAIDTINNKNDALRIAKYIYDRNNSGLYLDALQASFLRLFQLQEVQGKFNEYTDTISSTLLNQTDFTISQDGAFIAVKDSSFSLTNKNYKVLDSSGKVVAEFKDIKYAYFTNRPNILVVAQSNHLDKGNFTSNYGDLPSEFYLYDCTRKQKDTIFYENKWDTAITLQDGYLYHERNINLRESAEYDSYLIRYTASGNLVVPMLKRSKSALLGTVRVYSRLNDVVDLPSKSTISISKDGKAIMTGNNNKIPVIEVYTESGKLINQINNIYFADFTEKGSVIFIRNGVLKMRSPDGDTSRAFKISKDINYAFADGDESFALAKSHDSVFLVDAKSGIKDKFGEDLIDINFHNSTFVTKVRSPFNRELRNYDTLIYRRSFSGKKVNSFLCPDGIKDILYNKNRDELLVLTQKYQLLLLNKDLKRKCGFQLTPNDVYGISKEGNTIFYVRDSVLNVLSNSNKLIDLTTFDSAYQWLNTSSIGTNKLTKGERSKFDFPSNRIFRWSAQGRK